MGTIAHFVLGDQSVEDALRSVLDLALEAISTAVMAGVSMLGNDFKPKTAVATDERARAIDEAQYRDDTGPCLDAWREQRVVPVIDVATVAAEYPSFTAAALANDIHSTLSFPLLVAGASIGALNLYGASPKLFDEEDARVGLDVASAVATIIATTSYTEALELNLHLNRAIESRAVIEQAKGIIMASARCTPDAAFDILRQQSQSENRKLRELAEEIVTRQAR